MMQIRCLKWKEIPMWPPEWSISDQELGEEGVLQDVQFRSFQNPECIYVTARHQNETRKGVIILEDPAHLEVLYRKLKENLGQPLTTIGDLEINLSPSLPKRGPKQVRPDIEPNFKTRISK